MRQLISKKKLGASWVVGLALVAVLWFQCAVSVQAVAAGGGQANKPPIPADLLFQFNPVANEENAIFNWRQAAKLKVDLSDELNREIYYCWSFSNRQPSETRFEALKSWFHRNKEGLEVFNASISKPNAQWIEQDPGNPQPEMNALLLFIKARLFEVERLSSEKKFTNAVASLEDSLKLTQRGIDGDAAFIQYLVSARARALVEHAMVRLAKHRDLPVPLMERLLKGLPPLDFETNSYSRVLKVEFTRYSYRTTDVKDIADKWAKVSVTNEALTFYPENLRRSFKVLLDPSLVTMHPKPVDEVAEINRDIRYLRMFRTNSVGAWTNRDDGYLLEDENIVERVVEDIEPLMDLVKDEPLPLSRQAAEKARAAYLRIENPVGRIFAASLYRFTESARKVFISRTEREGMRTILGLLIFERRKGVLPAKLSDLVDANIFDSIPRDFFANGPMSYSRERRIIWSVGEDAEDNGGSSEDGKFYWYKDDAVWKIPTIN